MKPWHDWFSNLDPSDPRACELFYEQQRREASSTDRLFVGLMWFQWVAAIATAVWVSPLAWAGTQSTLHPHIYTAVFLGFGIIIFPVLLGRYRPGAVITRQIIAVAQALMSVLLIHLTGGRIETHFHVFGSLALLAFYRDWRVLLTATVVVAGDHFLRGILWPQSVYGTSIASPWRFAEHAGWVVIEDVFLFLSCRQGLREMWSVAERQSRLELTNQAVTVANEVLHAEIAERLRTERELERAKNAAEAANHAKSEFLANMSHELRTPLNAVIGFSDVLVEQICGPLNETQDQYVHDILDSGQHLLSLVNDVLDLAKIESGTMDFERSEVDVRGLVERSVQTFRERAVRSGVRLHTEVALEIDHIQADERRLKQVLYNFLGNAIKFTPEGGTITVRARLIDDECRLSVADTGVGIPAAEHAKIFETFYQVDSSLTKNKQGTGLGLALVRQIAEMHGGRVWVESEPGKGSEFFCSLPRGDAMHTASTRDVVCGV